MFTTTRNPLLPHGLVEHAGIAHNLLDIFSVTPAVERILCVILEGNVEHGTKIEIETKKTKQTSRDVAVAPNQIDIVLISQLLRIRVPISDAPQPRDASAFLI